jgi:hypothetical protein
MKNKNIVSTGERITCKFLVMEFTDQYRVLSWNQYFQEEPQQTFYLIIFLTL